MLVQYWFMNSNDFYDVGMRSPVSTFCLSLLFLLMVICPAEATAKSTFEEIVEKMNDFYYDQSFSGLDWKAEVEKTRRALKKPAAPERKYELIQKLLDRLGKSHLNLRHPFQKRTRRKIIKGSPKKIDFSMRVKDEKWWITRVEANSPGWRAGLRPGMNCVKLSEIDLGEANSSIQNFQFMQSQLFLYPEDDIEMTTINRTGQKKTIRFELRPFQGKMLHFGNIHCPEYVTFKFMKEDIAYSSFNIFLFPVIKKVIDELHQHQNKMKGLILDLRDNLGGVGMLAPALAKELSKESYNMGRQTGKGLKLDFKVFGQAHAYTGPLVILINEFSASTTEIFARALQNRKRAVIVGTTSAGMALPSTIETLTDGSIFQYPIADFKDERGKSLEGIGVIPDVLCESEMKDMEKNRDTQLLKALEVLKQ